MSQEEMIGPPHLWYAGKIIKLAVSLSNKVGMRILHHVLGPMATAIRIIAAETRLAALRVEYRVQLILVEITIKLVNINLCRAPAARGWGTFPLPSLETLLLRNTVTDSANRTECHRCKCRKAPNAVGNERQTQAMQNANRLHEMPCTRAGSGGAKTGRSKPDILDWQVSMSRRISFSFHTIAK